MTAEVHTPLDGTFLAGLLAIAAIVAGLALALRRRSAWSLALALLALTLFPICWVRILYSATVAERFLFTPGGAIALAVALAPLSLPALIGGAAAVAAALSVILAGRVPVWKDQGTLFGSMLRDSPESPHVHAILGDYFYRQRDLTRAAYHLRRVYELDPESRESLLNFSAAEDEMGHVDTAFVAVRLLLRLHGDYAPAWYALGNLAPARQKMTSAS